MVGSTDAIKLCTAQSSFFDGLGKGIGTLADNGFTTGSDLLPRLCLNGAKAGGSETAGLGNDN